MFMIQQYMALLVIFITTTAILYLPIFFILKKKGKGFIRQLSYLLCFWSFFLIIFAAIILFGLPIDFKPKRYTLNLKPLLWLEDENIRQRIMGEIIPNIMIFIPLGIFTPIVFKRTRKVYVTALAAFAVTFSVEFFQYFIGRSSDIDDLIANLSGGIIGYGIYKIFSYLFKNKTWWNKFAEIPVNEESI